MTKTVTLPIEEYEQLVNARKAADADMRKAHEIMSKHQVKVQITTWTDGIFHSRPLNSTTRVVGNDDFGVSVVVNEALNAYKELVNMDLG